MKKNREKVSSDDAFVQKISCKKKKKIQKLVFKYLYFMYRFLNMIQFNTWAV